ncbi:MAG: serine hydrolase, partial [Candidatus Delongbacteria bacterium]|nr:serine hydrolase [Candidatus Delongbacteria bacterium]
MNISVHMRQISLTKSFLFLILLPLENICLFLTRRDGMVTKQQINAVKSYLDDLSAKGNFNGSVLVGRKDKILFAKAYGYANFEWEVKNTIDTKFKLGSLTKPLTACLIILLAQKGMLQFQDKISKYIENTPKKWKDITIHHLLTHTSGILNFQRHKDWGSKNMYNTFKPLDFLEIIFKMKQEFKPGERYSYSNSAYYLLGIIIERITISSYEEAMRKFIFKPLSMFNSGLCSELDIVPKFADGYTLNNSKKDILEKGKYENMSIPYSAGGLYSTVEDLFKWSQGLENRDFLSLEYYNFLIEGNKYENDPFHRIVTYGLGKNTIKVSENLTKTILHHNG